MQVRLSSQNREIISYGTVFLFNKNGDFTLEMVAENSFKMTIMLQFTEENSNKSRVETTISENNLKITCINFASQGTGLTVPMELAIVDGKKIYFMFWAYLDGNAENKEKVRKVEYTLYSE